MAYLGETFAVDLPSCPDCQQVFVSEEQAVVKMAQTERMLEDKLKLMQSCSEMNRRIADNCSRFEEVMGDTLRPGGLELTEHLLGLVRFQPGSRILDAGCGKGATLQQLTQSCRHTAVGVDCSATMLAAASRKYSEFSLVCAALENLPFSRESFDGVICECVLSQTDVPMVLAEFQRVLRMDGVLLVSDIYRRPKLQSLSTDIGSDGRLATREKLERMLVAAGFMIDHWEDRTRDLQQLAARLIMTSGTSGENLFDWGRAGCGEGTDSRDVGYYLLVARKKPL